MVVQPSGRPGAVAVTLASLVGQTHRSLRVLMPDPEADTDGALVAVVRVLRARGAAVERPRRRRGRYTLVLDGDVVLEPEVVAGLLERLRAEGCVAVDASLPGVHRQEATASV